MIRVQKLSKVRHGNRLLPLSHPVQNPSANIILNVAWWIFIFLHWAPSRGNKPEGIWALQTQALHIAVYTFNSYLAAMEFLTHLRRTPHGKNTQFTVVSTSTVSCSLVRWGYLTRDGRAVKSMLLHHTVMNWWQSHQSVEKARERDTEKYI